MELNLTQPSVKNFDHHSSFIREALVQRKKHKPFFSYAYASSRLKISVSYLKNVVSRRHPLSLELVFPLGLLLEMSNEEIRYLAFMTARDQVKDLQVRSYFDEVLQQFSGESTFQNTNTSFQNSEHPETTLK